jgi:putative ABC transport system permease protein
MNILPIVLANVRRRKGRTALAILSTALSFTVVGMVLATHTSFSRGFSWASADHVVVLNRIAPFMAMPLAYATRIRSVDGVLAVGFGSSFRGFIQNRRNVVTVSAASEETFYDIFSRQMALDRPTYETWRNSRVAALVSGSLARQFGWKIGDQVPVLSDVRQTSGATTWDMYVAGIYEMRDGSESRTIYMHYTYFNEARLSNRDTVDSFDVLVRSPDEAASISRRIDQLFANASPQTRTAPLSVILQGILRQLGDINTIFVIVSLVVFVGMLLILSTVMITNTRETLSHYALLSAIGYRRSQLVQVALSEALLISIIGAAFGIWLAYILVGLAQEPLKEILDGLGLPPEGIGSLAVLAILFGAFSGIVPMLMVNRLQVASALRR